jgi:hypothetical protein
MSGGFWLGICVSALQGAAAGAAAGCLLFAVGRFSWCAVHAESLDLRCVFQISGYVDTQHLGEPSRCAYRPGIGRDIP